MFPRDWIGCPGPRGTFGSSPRSAHHGSSMGWKSRWWARSLASCRARTAFRYPTKRLQRHVLGWRNRWVARGVLFVGRPRDFTALGLAFRLRGRRHPGARSAATAARGSGEPALAHAARQGMGVRANRQQRAPRLGMSRRADSQRRCITRKSAIHLELRNSTVPVGNSGSRAAGFLARSVSLRFR